MRARFLVSSLVAGVVALACGGRTPLFLTGESSGTDGGLLDAPAGPDAPFVADVVHPGDGPSPSDASHVRDVSVEAGPCEDEQNTDHPLADCGGPDDRWFAWPYTPARDIAVSRIELHTTGGGLALMTSDAQGLPGSVLFQGTMPSVTVAQWLGADLPAPVPLQGGVLYYLVEEVSYCSQALGGTQLIEYYASTLAGPWGTTGTGSYTSHVFGTCS